jgi:tape measure domain-containing protein
MSDLSYTIGLDGSAFAGAAQRVLSIMGSLELATQLVARASGALTSSFEKASTFEKTAVAIGTITKSAEKTAAVMGDLKRLAADTPFEMSDLAPAARALLGAGTATSEVSKQLRVLGDIAAGADTDIGGLVSVFNQVRGKGKLSAEEFQQFAERGVAGLREEIAKFKGIDLTQVADALTAGAVSAKDLEAIFQRMTGSSGTFFQAMARQSQTFQGKLSTLSDAWSNLQVAFAQPINDALKPVLDDLTKLGETLAPVFEALGGQVAQVIGDFRNFIMQISTGSDLLDAFASSFGDLLGMVSDFAGIFAGAFADGFPDLAKGLFAALGPVLEWMGLKFEVSAHRFGSALQSALANVAKEIPLMGDAAKALETGAMGSAFDAHHADDKAKALDMSGGLAPAKDHIGTGLRDIAEGFSGRLNQFTGNYGASSQPAQIETQPPDWIDEIMAAAAPAIAAPFAQAGMQTSPTDVLASLGRLDSVLGARSLPETSAPSPDWIDRIMGASSSAPPPPPAPSAPAADATGTNARLDEMIQQLRALNTF